MSKNHTSPQRIERIRQQGYFSKTAEEISALAYGNRFAYQVCTSILIIGVLVAAMSWHL